MAFKLKLSSCLIWSIPRNIVSVCSTAGSLWRHCRPNYFLWGLYIGVLGIQDICHFTSRDIGYYPFTSRYMGYCVQYFRYFQGYWIFRKIDYRDICQFIRDHSLFTSRDMGYLVPPYTSLFYMVTNIFTVMTIIDPFEINRSKQVINRCITARSLQDLHVSLSGPVSSAGSFQQCQNKHSCSEHCQW